MIPCGISFHTQRDSKQCAQQSSRPATNLTMSTSLDSFDELTDFGVMGRPELADVLDSQEVKVLEERFLSKGTVVVTKDGSMLQAVHIRGSSRAREVWFAPSPLARQT